MVPPKKLFIGKFPDLIFEFSIPFKETQDLGFEFFDVFWHNIGIGFSNIGRTAFSAAAVCRDNLLGFRINTTDKLAFGF